MALNREFENAYDEFVTAWLFHEDLRHGGSIAELSASRSRLDGLRYEVALMARSGGI